MVADTKTIDWTDPRIRALFEEWAKNRDHIRLLSREIYDLSESRPTDELRLGERSFDLQRLRRKQAAVANTLGLDVASIGTTPIAWSCDD